MDETKRGWNDQKVGSWRELIEKLHDGSMVPANVHSGGHHRSNFVFRGMSCASWPLQTSLERLSPNPADVEEPLLRAFRKYSPPGTFRRDSDWETLAVAQHNGLKTRVLDWSASPLIAAHFATEEVKHRDQDGVIWCVDVPGAHFSLLPPHLRKILADDRAVVFDIRHLDHHLGPRTRFDGMSGEHQDLLIFFEPPSIDARIANQFGILSAMNGPTKKHGEFLWSKVQAHPDLVRRIVIKASAKPEIRDMLDQNNITERMLFPGLPGLCTWLSRYYGPQAGAASPAPAPPAGGAPGP